VNNPRELVAAGAGGAVGSLLDIGVLVLLVEHHTPVAMAAFCGAAAGAVMNFALNKYLAFRDRSPLNGRQLARFGLVAVATAALMAVAMQLVAVELGVPYVIAKLLCAAAVFAVWTYPAQRRLVFRRAASVPVPAPAV
jgi:putative flippase GtrA